MIRTESHDTESHVTQRKMPPQELTMPRLTHEQMLAILREGGVPESDARRWVDREARLAVSTSARPI